MHKLGTFLRFPEYRNFLCKYLWSYASSLCKIVTKKHYSSINIQSRSCIDVSKLAYLSLCHIHIPTTRRKYVLNYDLHNTYSDLVITGNFTSKNPSS